MAHVDDREVTKVGLAPSQELSEEEKTWFGNHARRSDGQIPPGSNWLLLRIKILESKNVGFGLWEKKNDPSHVE